MCLEDQSLHLLSSDLDVLDNQHKDQTKAHDRSTSDEHPSLCDSISLNNCDPSWAVHWIAQLLRKITIDFLPLRLDSRRKQTLEFRRERVGPDSARYAVTNGSTDVAEQSEERKDGGNIAVFGDRHHCHLLAENHGSTRECNEDLAHDDVSDVGVRLSKVYHEPHCERVQRYCTEEKPLEITSPAYQVANEQ